MDIGNDRQISNVHSVLRGASPIATSIFQYVVFQFDSFADRLISDLIAQRCSKHSSFCRVTDQTDMTLEAHSQKPCGTYSTATSVTVGCEDVPEVILQKN